MKKLVYTPALVLMAAALLSSCIQTNENSPGWEYMPDMYRSPAIEAYVDYGDVRDTLRPELMHRLSAMKPVPGTIPYSEVAMNDMPYPYPNTVEGYERAGAELKTPLNETKEVLERGAAIYNNFCVQCHGEAGEGNGKVVTLGNHPAPQAYNGPLKDLPEGKMFHTLTYGKGAMGSHASQLTKQERWEVVAYIKVLQRGGTLDNPTGEAAADSTATAEVPQAPNTAN